MSFGIDFDFGVKNASKSYLAAFFRRYPLMDSSYELNFTSDAILISGAKYRNHLQINSVQDCLIVKVFLTGHCDSRMCFTCN